MDAQGAVAALQAAKTVEDLEAAIASASFLDNTPGDDRQKLRGERRPPRASPSGRFRLVNPA